jgi:single-strand DNA-binding protein
MAASMNKVILIGRLGQDPKLSYTQSGQAVANLRMATDEGYKDKSGQWVDKAEWHNVVAWGSQAEYVSNYLAKGALILVEGRLQTRKWQDKDGQDRYTTEIVANRIQGLERRGGEDRQGAAQGAPEGSEQRGGGPRGGGQRGGGGRQTPQQGPEPEEDLGPAFPSEASGMDDVPF